MGLEWMKEKRIGMLKGGGEPQENFKQIKPITVNRYPEQQQKENQKYKRVEPLCYSYTVTVPILEREKQPTSFLSCPYFPVMLLLECVS